MAVILPILSTFNAAGVKSAQNSLSGLGGTLSALGKRAAGAVAGFQALQGAINFTGDAIAEARDLERNLAALATVFTDLTPRMTTFVNNANNMGLSQVEAARTTTYLGSVLKQAGFGMDEVADNTEKLTILAQDLATTFGYDTTVALTAMTAMFRGEYDPIEKFGVALKQNEVNALVAAKGLGHLTGVAMLNAQQMVRMEQLFLRSRDAQGAFARQSGTLFVEQKKLTAGFSNMQAAIGLQLTPALADMMQQLVPIVEDLTPKLVETFNFLGTTISNLVPIIKPLGTIFETLVDVTNTLFEILTPLGNNIASVLIVAFENLASVVERANYWITVIHESLKELNLTVDETKPAPITEWLEGLGDRLGSLNLLYNLAKQFKEQVQETNTALGLSQLVDQGGKDRAASRARASLLKRGLLGTDGDESKEELKGTARNAVKDFYANIADEMAKQSAMLKLKKLGLSEALIDSVVGSGEDWKKVFNRIKGLSKSALAELQSNFRKTGAGQKELADLQKKLQDEADARYEAAKKIYDAQLAQYEAQVESINTLRKALGDAASATIPLGIVTREIGQFEAATISAFDNIAETISSALADGTLLKTAADNLTNYARKEQAVIANLMRQRDAIATKRSLAEAMLKDVKDAVVGMANITQILKSDAGDITQTITKMVGNIQVSTSKIVKGVVGGPTELVASFTEIINKTKNFAEQLKSLRALGLNQNLYQQIVDAGIDAGGTTAKAILEGGSGTVSELNNLFNELNMAGAEIANNSAEVMFGAGVDLTTGLINGLISKEQELVDTATKLAQAFTTAFNSQISISTPMPVAPVAPVQEMIAPQLQAVSYTLKELANIDLKTVTTDALWKDAAALAKKLIATPQYTKGTVVNVTVKADVTTNGKTAGQAILAQLNKYAKANS
jgi:hypothetical protein